MEGMAELLDNFILILIIFYLKNNRGLSLKVETQEPTKGRTLKTQIRGDN